MSMRNAGHGTWLRRIRSDRCCAFTGNQTASFGQKCYNPQEEYIISSRGCVIEIKRGKGGTLVSPITMIRTVCFDLGDTLIAEETVIHDSCGRAIAAQLVEHAPEVLEAVRKQSYKIALVANDDSVNVRNLLRTCSLENYFDVKIISEEVGIEKPDERIFQLALDELGVKPGDAVMVGNRLDTDIQGANRTGMKSVWFNWNDRYDSTIKSQEQKPDFTIESLTELTELLTKL